MKIKYFHLFFALILLPGFFACEYEPSGENFREIAPPDTTRMIQINLSPFETQYVFTKLANVNYDLNTFGLKIYNVEFFVGDQSIHQGNEAKGFFMFQPGLYGQGEKTMTMKVTTNSNTQSLSDILGVEALIYQQSWKVILDGEAPNAVEITKIFNDNGVLKLEWEEYKRINFTRYAVYRRFGRVSDQAETQQIASFTDPKQVSCYDYSYIGGYSTYWVVVEGSDQSSISTKKEINFTPPKLDILWLKGDSARFVWQKNTFYKAVKKVDISLPNAYPKPNSSLYTSENTNDTVVTINNLRFGNSEYYRLSTYPKTEIGLFDNKQILKSDISLTVGEQIPKAIKMLGSPTENYMFLWNGKVLSKLDMVSKKVVSSVSGESFFDWFFSSYDGNLYTHNPKLTRYNKNNLNDNQTFSPADFGIHDFWTTTSISSNNRIAGPIGLYIGYYDITENRLVFTEKNTNIGWCDFSPDGKYAFKIQSTGYADQMVFTFYEVTETGLNKIGQLPPSLYRRWMWIPENNHKLLLLDGYEDDYIGGKEENTVRILDAATLKTELEFKVKVGHLTNLDFYTKQIAFWNKNPLTDEKRKLYIYNYETGKLVNEINLVPIIEELSIFRSQVLSSEGFCLDYSKL